MQACKAGGSKGDAMSQWIRQAGRVARRMVVIATTLLGFVASERAFAQPAGAAPALPEITTIATAEFCQAAELEGALPGAECSWKTVRLAHTWHVPPGVQIGEVWYRLKFEVSAFPRFGLGMYTVALNRAARIYVNGQMLRDFGVTESRLPMNWNRAQFASIPRALLRQGSNEILIEERDYWWEHGWLAPIQIGDEDTLKTAWARRVFWQNDTVRILAASTGTVGALMLLIWLKRRDDTMYLWFAFVSLLWTLTSFDYFSEFPPFPPREWEQFVRAAPVLRGALMFIFILRYCGMRRPRLEMGVWAYFAIGTCLILADAMNGALAEWWYFLILVASFYFLYVQVMGGLRRSILEGILLAGAGIVQMALSGYDLWLFGQKAWTDRVYLAHFSAPVYIVVVAIIICRRVTEAQVANESLAGVLEVRVVEKTAELERNYEHLAEATRATTLANERSRIMSEMHDGIGSQLTMALSLVRRHDHESDPEHAIEDGQVATVLRECIEDLQLIIDSLEPVENDLLTVLGTLRYRLQHRLGQGGVSLKWNVVDLPPLPMLTPQSVLSILRIVQEAFANCLKHAGATNITLTTALSGSPGFDESAQIRIVDDGHGLKGERQGRGLENMRRRARELGGELTISSQPGRTEVLLRFPTLRELAE